MWCLLFYPCCIVLGEISRLQVPQLFGYHPMFFGSFGLFFFIFFIRPHSLWSWLTCRLLVEVVQSFSSVDLSALRTTGSANQHMFALVWTLNDQKNSKNTLVRSFYFLFLMYNGQVEKQWFISYVKSTIALVPNWY